ncbi:DUF1549 domain-containing protein [Novipirellula artificiosorum]|uniref:Translocation protein TolB n=1 Tax=Novipirellula artificiosorum TaxID=2528016 RepID=A0A5C6DJZ1_9BACT|nr:DUF1549 domain-containing protein [Novipirellula artificiosorum]TWU35911.1 translocation protein TolB [Novipirellula artificiosorum]
MNRSRVPHLLAYVTLLCSGVLVLGGIADAADETEPAAEAISFAVNVEPILREKCWGCHQRAKSLGDYVMSDFDSLLRGGETGQSAIVPGAPDESYLLEQIVPVNGHAEMPKPPFPALTDGEIDTITRWIAEGAKNDSLPESTSSYDASHPPVYIGFPSLPSVDVSPDGKWIAVAGFHEVVLLDAQSGRPAARLIGISPRINTVRFSPDGERLAAVGGTPAVQGEVQIWDVVSGELSLSRLFTYDALCGASWSPDGSMLAFGAADNAVRAIEVKTGTQVLFQGAHEDWVRDTVFTPDGQHLVSVARDMSCKLTEVETERFVDNVTSITPGALSGGLNSIAVHPQRNEILVGGSDGIAKVYRVFRETERKIGDDANLIRAMPEMPGRIFGVAVSPDGSRLAAASTLDGNSEVRVWKYDFTGMIDGELKKILAKRTSERGPDENKAVEAYLSKPVVETARWKTSKAAVYAIRFAPDNSLLFTANDGNVRRLDPDGKLTGEYSAVFKANNLAVASDGFDAKAWTEAQAERPDHATSESPIDLDSVRLLTVYPASITLDTPYAYSQLVIMASDGDATSFDVTRHCEIQLPSCLAMTPTGLIRPTDNGEGELRVRLGSLSQTVSVSVSGVESRNDSGAVDYIHDVNPVLSRLGCNQGTCHGAQKGKNGFKLSLRGYDPVFDLRALKDDLASRRIDAASPDDSLMLRKPLGLTPHQGGVLMKQGDPNHAILKRWIADGSQIDFQSPRVASIEISPINPVVMSIGSRQQIRITATYRDGRKRDVTAESFVESGNTEVATTNRSGLLTSIRRGEAPILARFEGAYAATTLTVMGKRPEYKEPQLETWTPIDELVAAKWKRVKVVPSELCDDATFLRRVYLDLTGLLPSSDKVRAFLRDESSSQDKRTRMVDELIGSDDFVEYWTNKWADLLQVNRKFLGVEGSTRFRQWIRDGVADNQPYDQFVAEILTASGSNHDNPPASYFKTLRTAEDTMENTTHLFLGIRFNCNKCHDHPFERWTQDQYYELSAFFAQVDLKTDPASGKRKVGGSAVEGAKPLFEIVVDKQQGEVTHARTGKVVAPEFPFEVPFERDTDRTRREILARWVTDANNPYFARSYVNRLWGYLMGIGLIEPIDDIRAGNPPSNPKLLEFLTREFINSGFDTRKMLRLICTSRTYQLSIETNPLNDDDQLNYSHAIPRRLPAEVIFDTVHQVTGAVSEIPGMPKGTRAAAVTDSGIELADGFLQNLGRPVRESACECERSSELQLGPVMALVSGPTVASAIVGQQNELAELVKQHPEDRMLVEEIFVRALGRFPTAAEQAAVDQIRDQIMSDHDALAYEVARAESEWKRDKAELEMIRLAKFAATAKEISDREQLIAPERLRLEEARKHRVTAAEKALQEAENALAESIEGRFCSETSVEWHPLTATKAIASNDTVFAFQPDRSIRVSGKAEKGTYTIEFKTSLTDITGFRLETLASAELPAGGPGLGENGNFVLTEIEIYRASAEQKGLGDKLAIAAAKADFAQDSYAVEQAIDGQTRGNGGWAVAAAFGIDHWATFQLKQPIHNEADTRFTLVLHQFHSADMHRIGRLRISATTAEGDIPLGYSESIAAVLATAKADRTAAATKVLVDYAGATDSTLAELRTVVAEARKPVPPDVPLQKLKSRRESLSVETPDAPALVRLRSDLAASTQQQTNRRLTATEDLVWALINSPAFLFNH